MKITKNASNRRRDNSNSHSKPLSKAFLIVVVCFLTLFSVSFVSAVVESHGARLEFVNSGIGDNEEGVKVGAIEATNVISMAISTGTTADTCTIQNDGGSSDLATGSIVGLNCNITYTLAKGKEYRFIVTKTGGGHNVNGTLSSSYPYSGGNGILNFTTGINSGAENSARLWGIVSITVEDANASTFLISPANNTADFGNVTFQATVAPKTAQNVTNATLFIWHPNGTLFNQTINIISGDVTNTTNFIVNLNRLEKFEWNVLGCSANTTGTECVFDSSNKTLTGDFNFGLCNASLTVPYINFTFVNETLSLESTNASFASSFQVWVNDAPINKTFTFLNTTENVNYQFCFSPGDKSINADYSINYLNSISQQRIFSSSEALTNTTTTKKLYLLPTILGLFAQFQTIDPNGNVIQAVKGSISRTIGATTFIAASGFTDSSGIITYFLNPDITYAGLFTASGFVDNAFSFVPITDQRLVIMGIVGGGINGSEISQNTSYSITPTNSSLQNNTFVDFGFNVNSTNPITLISINLTNSSGSQLGFNSSTSSGLITLNVSTGNHSQIIGTYVIQTADETITVTNIWIVGNEFIGDYSLYNQLDVFVVYGFSDFIRLVMVLAVIMGLMIFMSVGEITDTSESKIIVAMLLIWAFSIVGWLDNPAVVSDTGLALFARQYGIAILSTGAVAYLIMRRLFIRRI